MCNCDTLSIAETAFKENVEKALLLERRAEKKKKKKEERITRGSILTREL